MRRHSAHLINRHWSSIVGERNPDSAAARGEEHRGHKNDAPGMDISRRMRVASLGENEASVMRILTPLEVFQSHSPLDGKVKPTGHVAVNWTEAPDNPLVGKGLQIAGRRADGMTV